MQLQTTQVASIPDVSESSAELSQEAASSLQQQIENSRLALLSRSEDTIYSVDELGMFCEHKKMACRLQGINSNDDTCKKKKKKRKKKRKRKETHIQDAQQHV